MTPESASPECKVRLATGEAVLSVGIRVLATSANAELLITMNEGARAHELGVTYARPKKAERGKAPVRGFLDSDGCFRASLSFIGLSECAEGGTVDCVILIDNRTELASLAVTFQSPEQPRRDEAEQRAPEKIDEMTP